MKKLMLVLVVAFVGMLYIMPAYAQPTPSAKRITAGQVHVIWGPNATSATQSAPVDQLSMRSAADAETQSTQIVKPGATMNAIPPYFSGWSMVSGSQSQLRGPFWEQDWYITFLIPNRGSMPRYINVAAKNMNGTWLNYTGYTMLYTRGPYGSSYKITYCFGGYRSLLTGINMWDATNWALYYHD